MSRRFRTGDKFDDDRSVPPLPADWDGHDFDVTGSPARHYDPATGRWLNLGTEKGRFLFVRVTR